MNNQIFEPDIYALVRKPLLNASTLPPHCYTSQAFFQREIEQIFLKHWQFVGHQSQIQGKGDYLCHDGIGGSLIIIRDDSDEIRAFANSCRHRGSQLLSASGKCRKIVCPYHSWVYKLNGELARAVGMEDAEAFNKADYPLIEFPVKSWAGFIFINYAQTPPSFEDHLGNMPLVFQSHQTSKMKHVGSLQFEIQSNWKLLAENALEAYHTGTVHRDTLGQQESRSIKTSENWTGLIVEDEHSVATMQGDDKPFPHITGLAEEAKKGAYFTLLFPSTQFVFAQDCMWWLAFKPVQPDVTELTLGACFPEDIVQLDDFDDKLAMYFRRWELATREDTQICELQQQGQIFDRKPGRFSASEFAVHRMSNWILDQVLGK